MSRKPWRIGTRAKLLLRGLRYLRLMPYASIDGWLSVDEAITLYELSRCLPHEQPLAVEIGSWQGKSSVCLATGLRGKWKPRLCCIDPFDASGDGESSGLYGARAERLGSGLRTTFETNLREVGVHDLVDVRQGRSHEQAQLWKEPIDLLFLDGDHSYDSVRQDFEDWAPKVRPGGFLCLHDANHELHTGPRRIVEECIRKDPMWVDGRFVDSMFVTRKAMA
ncbi:MAG: class I SAM-dependent methyltransferase [Planctomycetota bacterium]